ncbi:MAG TPA: CsgG/HfaB family protein [Spirochaetota bacterium]|nr:CsgG/HfaB family protein [Spirochaetota bacterium]HQE59970.1 CsgG/HfaB family protein [Spirochaetota bacterium]
MRKIMFLMIFVALVGCETAQKQDSGSNQKLSVIVDDLSNQTGEAEYNNVLSSVSPDFSSAIQKTGKFIIVERKRLGKVLEELEFNASGLVSPKSMKKIGEITGADAVLFIELNEVNYSDTDSDRVLYTSTNQEMKIRLSAKLVDTESAEIISNVSKSYECENSVKYIFSDLMINKKIEKSEILSKLISDSAEDFTREIARKTSTK